MRDRPAPVAAGPAPVAAGPAPVAAHASPAEGDAVASVERKFGRRSWTRPDLVAEAVSAGRKVVDLSADFRLPADLYAELMAAGWPALVRAAIGSDGQALWPRPWPLCWLLRPARPRCRQM